MTEFVCKRCTLTYRECECPSYNELRAWEQIKDVPNVMGLIKRGQRDYLLVLTSSSDSAGAAFNCRQLIPDATLYVAYLGDTRIFANWPTKWMFDKREKATQ